MKREKMENAGMKKVSIHSPNGVRWYVFETAGPQSVKHRLVDFYQ